jgi:uncharacterized protein (TIGR00251 family)
VSGAFTAVPDGLAVRVRVIPNAGADRVEAVETRDDGTDVIRVRVRAVPDKGRANAAVIALFATALGVPKSAVSLTAGAAARQKALHIAGDPRALAARLAAHLDHGD